MNDLIKIASTIPTILNDKGIDITNLLSVRINSNEVVAHLYLVQDVMKFDNFEIDLYDKVMHGFIGEIHVEYLGINFFSNINEEEIDLIK